MRMAALLLGVSLVACGGGGTTSDPDAPTTADGPAATDLRSVLSAANVTTLPGASPNAGATGTFSPDAVAPGTGSAPKLSNTVLSAIPGAPPKILFVGQDTPFDSVIVSIDGLTGSFEVPAARNPVIGLDLVTAAGAPHGQVTVHIATRAGVTTSAASTVTLLVDPHVVIAAGDLENHDTDGTNIADLFGAVLEGLQGAPAAPRQITDGTNNNDEIVGGVKGFAGSRPFGHREIVWDGVPETLRNVGTFKAAFFDRQAGGAAGVQGGAIFTPVGGTGEMVDDAYVGVKPDPATFGPPTHDNAPLGGDFSDVNPAFGGNLISFTQDATFAPLGTTITDVTFHVASTSQPAVISGMGVVFISVDDEQASSIELFDESNASIAKVVVPPRSLGPFPFGGPIESAPDAIPFSFAGYVDRSARIARVRITSGAIPVDLATLNDSPGTPDVVVLDDIYYGEPKP